VSQGTAIIIPTETQRERFMKPIFALFVLAGLPGLAQAHGHHPQDLNGTVQHLLADAYHLLPLVLLVGLALTLRNRRKDGAR
jgi:hypothetical protein